MPAVTVHGYEVTLLIDLCKVIIAAHSRVRLLAMVCVAHLSTRHLDGVALATTTPTVGAAHARIAT